MTPIRARQLSPRAAPFDQSMKPAELGVHFVQIPQCHRIQVDGDVLEWDRDDIVD
ncbi:hypothetical protein HBI81_231200, partial [Parastagonospora nodorum]